MRLLLVEDDLRIGEFLQRGLRQEGFEVSLAAQGGVGLELATREALDVIVLDLMLPDISGLAVCQQLRAVKVSTPVLMLTALDTIEHKVSGLQIGADDYLTKPFDADELLARLHALIRRSRHVNSKTRLSIGDLCLDMESLTAHRGATRVELTARELALLELLMRSPGKVFSRDEILNTIWGYNEDPMTNIVDVYISRLRQNIHDNTNSILIRTVRGIGYKIQAD